MMNRESMRGYFTVFNTANSSRIYSPEDQKILEAEYSRNPKPDRAARLEIVSRVALGEKEVQVSSSLVIVDTCTDPRSRSGSRTDARIPDGNLGRSKVTKYFLTYTRLRKHPQLNPKRPRKVKKMRSCRTR
jgi:Homeodomain